MGISKISIGLAAAALLGATPVMAAAPVTPSVANLSIASVAGTNLAFGSRLGSTRATRSNDLVGGAALIGVIAAAAVVGGVVAATDGGSNKNATSP